MDDPLREIKEGIHEACGCSFSSLELDRLRSIKQRKRWLPADKRHGYRPLFGFTLQSKRKDSFYKELLEEFNAIVEGREKITNSR